MNWPTARPLATIACLLAFASVQNAIAAYRNNGGFSQVDKRKKTFQGLLQQRFDDTRQHIQKTTNQVFRMKGERGPQIFFRMLDGLDQALQLHDAYFKLAHDVGAGSLVPSGEHSILTIDGTPREGMAVEYVGDSFVSGRRAIPYVDRVSEETRTMVALLDFLTDQLDRRLDNLLLSPAGEVRLIDHDASFGHVELTEKWYNGKAGVQWKSVFFPGGILSFDPAKQKSVTDLPRRAQRLLHKIGKMSSSKVAETYGLTSKEAARLQYLARRVIEKGLTGAIETETPDRLQDPDQFVPLVDSR